MEAFDTMTLIFRSQVRILPGAQYTSMSITPLTCTDAWMVVHLCSPTVTAFYRSLRLVIAR